MDSARLLQPRLLMGKPVDEMHVAPRSPLQLRKEILSGTRNHLKVDGHLCANMVGVQKPMEDGRETFQRGDPESFVELMNLGTSTGEISNDTLPARC